MIRLSCLFLWCLIMFVTCVLYGRLVRRRFTCVISLLRLVVVRLSRMFLMRCRFTVLGLWRCVLMKGLVLLSVIVLLCTLWT